MDREKNSSNICQLDEVKHSIEITPQMIEAGLDVMSEFECEYMGSEESLVRAYEAMVRESLR